MTGLVSAQTLPDAQSVSSSGRVECALGRPLYASSKFISARRLGDFGWTKITVDQDFVDVVLELHTRVTTRGLVHCAVSWMAQGWDGAKQVDGTLASLHVNERSCWLRTHPKNSDLAIETLRMDIAELIDAIFTGQGTTPVLWYQGALVYGSADGFDLLRRLIACGELKA